MLKTTSMWLIGKRHMTNENNMCSKISSKYKAWVISYDLLESKSEAKESESVPIIHFVFFCELWTVQNLQTG